MNHLLITGATGFIGSHLLPILTQQNYQITITTRRNLPEIETNNLKIVKIEKIDGETDWSAALTGIDVVIHLAARAHILQETDTDGEKEFYQVNTEGTINLARQAQQAGVKQFIFLSSIGAMATLSEEKLTENSLCQPDTPYGRSKKAAEEALVSLTSLNTTIIRPTLVYGPRNPGNMERLLKLVESGLPLPLGGIKNRRSLTYVGNLVDAIAKMIGLPQAYNQTFLISDGQDVSTPELIEYLAEAMGKNCQILPIPPKLLLIIARLATSIESWTGKSLPLNQTTVERLVGSLYVDDSHLRTTLNWDPPYSLKQGIEKTISHSRSSE